MLATLESSFGKPLERQVGEISYRPEERTGGFGKTLSGVGHGPSHNYSQVYHFILKEGLLGRGGTIYDLGCGDGSSLFRLHFDDPTRKIVGVDISESSIKLAKGAIELYDMGDKVSVIRADCRRSPLKPNGADYVLLIDVLLPQDRESAQRMLDICAEACRPGGRIIASTASRDYGLACLDELGEEKTFLENDLRKGILRHPNGKFVGTAYTKDELEAEFLARGCEVETYEMSCRDFLGPKVPPEYTEKIWNTPTALIAVATKGV
ncbi:MAG: class I SAM-dependent methyltransferase [Candidatus Aenigmatarchaeota archaeon]